jgi:hypothetical protein
MKGPEALDAAAGRVAESLSGRLHDIRVALDRWDNFVHDPAGGGPEIVAGGSDPAALLAREFVLRALRVGLEPVNFRILERLAAEATLTIGAVIELTGLPRVIAVERANDLAQVGLASHAIEAGTLGLVGLVQAVAARVAARSDGR